MKAYKLEVLIIDQDVNSIIDAIELINNTRYPNHTNVSAYSCASAEIGEWHDEHPLNCDDTFDKEIERLFNWRSK